MVIARRDKPVVRLVLEKPKKPAKRSLGFGAGKGYFSKAAIEYLTDNPELDEEITKDFEDSMNSNKWNIPDKS